MKPAKVLDLHKSYMSTTMKQTSMYLTEFSSRALAGQCLEFHQLAFGFHTSVAICFEKDKSIL